MFIVRTIGRLFLGFWLLVGLVLAVAHLTLAENVGGGRDKAIDLAEAETGEDLSNYRGKAAAPATSRTVAEQWELERREAEDKARYERSY